MLIAARKYPSPTQIRRGIIKFKHGMRGVTVLQCAHFSADTLLYSPPTVVRITKNFIMVYAQLTKESVLDITYFGEKNEAPKLS